MESRDLQATPVRAVRVSTRVAAILARAAAAGAHPRVAGVHARAINVRIGGALLTIAHRTAGGLPAGVLVDGAFAPRESGVQVDDRLRIDGPLLQVAGLIIDLSAAVPWSPHLAPQPIPIDLAERAAVLRSAVDPRGAGDAAPDAADRRRSTGPAIGPGGIVRSAVGARVAALRASLADGDESSVRRSGRALVGLGIGLTPTGDDVLVGLSAALTAAGDPSARILAADWAAWAHHRTSEVACAFHRAAAQGDYAERLHDLLGAVLGAPVAAIPTAADRAAAWGATSGLDTIDGVLLGLDAVAARRAGTSRARRSRGAA